MDACLREAHAEIAREVGRALWPGLERELRSARADLDGLVRALRIDRGRVLRDEGQLTRHEERALRTRRAGWCLGVLAVARGIDLLYRRREPEGLRWMIGALTEACGFALAPLASEVPRIAGNGGADWQTSLLAGWCTLQAGSADGRVRLAVREDGATLVVVFEAPHVSVGDWPEAVRHAARASSLPIELAGGQLVLSST